MTYEENKAKDKVQLANKQSALKSTDEPNKCFGLQGLFKLT